MTGNPAPQNYVVRFPRGERIFTEGDIGTTMFVVQSGEVNLFREREGSERPFATMEKGDFFGEMSVLEGLPRTSSAEAASECELIEINSMTFDRMIRGNIEIAVRMLRKLSIRLRKAEKTIEDLQSAAPSKTPLAAAAAPGALPRVPEPAAASAPAPTPATPAPRTQSTPKPSASAPAPLHTPPPPPAPVPAGAPQEPVAARAPGSGPRLISEGGNTVFPLAEAESLIGRFDPVTETQPEVDLTTLDLKRSVSRRHARITVSNGSYFLVEEVGALNGTFVNGTRLTTGRPTELKDGDSVGLGTVRLQFRR